MLRLVAVNKSLIILLIVFIGLASIGIGKAISLSDRLVDFALLGLMIFACIGAVFFSKPKVILSLYLFTIVNLDFIRLLDEPFNITVDILFSFILVVFIIILLFKRNPNWFQTPVQKAFLLYLAITLVCVVLSVAPLVSLKRWVRFFSYYLFINLILDVVRDKATVEKLSHLLIYAAIVPCFIGYYALFAHTPNLVGENLRMIYGIEMVRIKSVLSHANTFGLFLSIVIPLSIGLLMKWNQRNHPLAKLLIYSTLFCTLPMLYLTYSRIGWVVTFSAIIILLILQKRWRLLTVFPWLFSLFVWITPGFLTRWSDIIDPSQPDSLDWRRSLYAFSLRKFVQKPIFGSGPGTFLEYVSFGKGYTQHHLWIGSLVESGIVGTLALAVLLFVVWIQLMKYVRVKPTALNFCALSIFSAMMFVSIVGDPFNLPSTIIYLWTLIGLTMAEYRLNTKKSPMGKPLDENINRHQHVSNF